MLLKKACLVFLLICTTSGAVFAEKNIHLEAGLGSVFTSNADYEPGYVLDNAFAYTSHGLAYRIGVLHMGDIEPEGEGFGSDSDIEINGVYLGLTKVIDLDAVELEVGGGLIASETVVTFLGRELDEDSDSSPMINAKLIIGFGEFFAIQGDWKYIDDLSGGDLHLFQAGVRFSF